MGRYRVGRFVSQEVFSTNHQGVGRCGGRAAIGFTSENINTTSKLTKRVNHERYKAKS